MNMICNSETGDKLSRIPLVKSAKIIQGNALKIDWNNLDKTKEYDITADVTNVFEVNEPKVHYETLNVFSKKVNINPTHIIQNEFIAKSKYDYILGNPPFIGKSNKNIEQKADLERVFSGVKGFGVLDYVTAWYLKAAQYIQNTKTKVAFVSTNSITQGEQVGVLWNLLFNHYRIKIHFAHRTFQWNNEARGNAAVHCVIIGFANFDIPEKLIFEYENIKGEAHEIKVKNINPYLVEGKDIVILSRKTPICNVPKIVFGSMPNDNGNLLLSKQEYEDYKKIEPQGAKYIKEFTGGEEFINKIERFCFWLNDINPSELRDCPLLLNRIDNNKNYRLKSSRENTKKLAEYPMLFGEIRQPKSDYILIPNLSSGLRKYIPIGFKSSKVITSNLALIIPNAKVYHFGILTSIMHMSWVRYTCGMLSTSLRYSNNLVYNNFPWPENPTEKQIKLVEQSAQKVLDIRAYFPESSLADLYDPRTMPPALVKAHQELDKAVDLCYRSQAFTNESKRIEFLFELYDKYTADLFTNKKNKN